MNLLAELLQFFKLYILFKKYMKTLFAALQVCDFSTQVPVFSQHSKSSTCLQNTGNTKLKNVKWYLTRNQNEFSKIIRSIHNNRALKLLTKFVWLACLASIFRDCIWHVKLPLKIPVLKSRRKCLLKQTIFIYQALSILLKSPHKIQ